MKKRLRKKRLQLERGRTPAHIYAPAQPINLMGALDSLRTDDLRLLTNFVLKKHAQRAGYSLPPELMDASDFMIVPPSFMKSLIGIATNAWRARSKMIERDSAEPKDEMKRVFRHIEGIYDQLRQVGCEIVDHTGRTYDSGMAIQTISFEPTPGLTRDEILETVKPTITLQGKIVQMGEVVVGTPIKQEGHHE